MQQPSSGPTHPAAPRPRPGRRGPLILLTIGVLCALALIGFFVSGPYRALKGLQTAIAFDDANALNAYVDFETLRANLKRQLNARTQAKLNAALPNGLLSQIASGIAGSVTDAAVDELVTPTGLNQLVLGASLIGGQLQGQATGTLAQRFESGSGSFEASDRFVYTIRATPNRELTLVLTRNGLGWRLTNVVLPIEP